MPVVEIEIKDDGSVGTLPEPVQKFLNDKINESFGKGAAKAAAEAKAQIDREIARVKSDPAEAERSKTLEIELSKLKEADAAREKNFEEAQRLRDERHGKELQERESKTAALQQEIDRRTGRIRELVADQVHLAAAKHGARAESMPELKVLLAPRIALGDDLQPFVADAADHSKPALDQDGKPVTIEGLVAQYLTQHPHHKAGPVGRGGGASGGVSVAGRSSVPESAFEQAASVVAQKPTLANVAAAMKSLGQRG